MKRFYLLWLLTFLLSEGFAQDIPVKQDSLIKITPAEALPLDTDTMRSGNVILKPTPPESGDGATTPIYHPTTALQ